VGYSISMEQANKLERNRREGRLCAMSTGRGGCFTRATWVEKGDSWYYEEDMVAGKEPHPLVHTVCAKHRMGAGYKGRNFVVHTSEKLPRSKPAQVAV
jgi:hypothetical protein